MALAGTLRPGKSMALGGSGALAALVQGQGRGDQ